MTSTDRVKSICKERKIPISRLERECGFSNGYIGQLKKGLPDDRCLIVAEYLGVTADFLRNGSCGKSNLQLEFESVIADLTVEEMMMALDMIKAIKAHRK